MLQTRRLNHVFLHLAVQRGFTFRFSAWFVHVNVFTFYIENHYSKTSLCRFLNQDLASVRLATSDRSEYPKISWQNLFIRGLEMDAHFRVAGELTEIHIPVQTEQV